MIGISNFSGHTGANDFVGIKRDGLENIKLIIQEYEKSVENIIEGMVTEAGKDNAFKGGELTVAIDKFVNAVKEEAKEWASQINRYCATIDDILSKMTSAESQLASGLDQSTQSVSSQTSKYNYGGGSSSAS